MRSVSCLNPKVIFNKYLGELISVPCGKCAACRTHVSQLWTRRLQEECACHTYTLFLTLTYADCSLPVKSVECVEDKDAVMNSLDFVKFHDGFVPCVCSSDYQKFFKRLRKHLIIKNGFSKDESKGMFRYFLATEYGPTTFRPHCHMLLWFDSPKIAATIKECIYKSWRHKVDNPPISKFFRRNVCRFVRGNAASYVAGYLNCFDFLPPVLLTPQFRTFHLQSIAPPIGTLRVYKERLRQIFSEYSCTVTLRNDKDTQLYSVPLWRSFEDRLFPRCKGFAQLSLSDKCSLYKLSSLYGQEFSSFKEFEERFVTQWYSQLPLFSLVRRVLKDPSEKEEDYPYSSRVASSLRCLYYTSVKFRRLRLFLGLSVFRLVEKIEEYYRRKNYSCLLVQLEMQQYMSEMSLTGDTLSYYPFLVDDLFYANLRNLNSFAYDNYLSQFSLNEYDMFKYTSKYSSRYADKKCSSEKIISDNTKCRIKKDFIASHPEYADFYKFNLFHLIS